MKNIRPCDHCGDKAAQVKLRAEHDTPLAIITRGLRRGLETETDLFCFELTNRADVPISNVPILCQRCFRTECDRALARYKDATFGELVASLRRRIKP